IAVAIGVDRRSRNRIVGWDFPLRRHAKDLASWRVQILGKPRMGGIARSDVKHAIGAEGDTAAIVKGTGRDSDDDISIKLRMITLMLQTDDCVGAPFPFLSCEHDIDVGALRKLRMQGKARQTTLAMGGDLQGRIGLLGKLATGPYQADLPSPLA